MPLTARAIAAAALLVAGCAPDAPVPDNATAPSPPAQARRVGDQPAPGRDAVVAERLTIPELDGRPIAQGAWRDVARGAAFDAGNLRFTIACAPGGVVAMTMTGAARSIQIIADRGATRFDVVDGVARFPARYPWFADVLARAETAIALRADDGEAIGIPVDARIGRAIAACR